MFNLDKFKFFDNLCRGNIHTDRAKLWMKNKKYVDEKNLYKNPSGYKTNAPWSPRIWNPSNELKGFWPWDIR